MISSRFRVELAKGFSNKRRTIGQVASFLAKKFIHIASSLNLCGDGYRLGVLYDQGEDDLLENAIAHGRWRTCGTP